MILRSLTKHVNDQNWFAVGIEFVILVLGVFIGLQVQDWSTARETQARSEAFSERLLDDFRFEAWVYAYKIAYHKEVLVNAERAANALTGKKPMTDEQFLISTYRATQFIDYPQRRATYDELIATGDIGLIRDDKLRETAVTLFSLSIAEPITQQSRISDYRKMFREITPINVQSALLNRCGDRLIEPGDFTKIVGTLEYPCTLDLPNETLVSAAASLRAEQRLLPALQLRFANLETAIIELETYNGELYQDLREITADSP